MSKLPCVRTWCFIRGQLVHIHSDVLGSDFRSRHSLCLAQNLHYQPQHDPFVYKKQRSRSGRGQSSISSGSHCFCLPGNLDWNPEKEMKLTICTSEEVDFLVDFFYCSQSRVLLQNGLLRAWGRKLGSLHSFWATNEFQVSLGYVSRPWLRKQNKKVTPMCCQSGWENTENSSYY